MTDVQNPLAAPQDRIEILSVELLNQNRSGALYRPLVEELKTLAGSLRLEFGWHYLLDLTWTIQNLANFIQRGDPQAGSVSAAIQGKAIMDAGAGIGIMQWYLAQAGAQVYSVDRMSRANLPLRFRNRFNVHGLRTSDLAPARSALINHLHRPLSGPFYRRWAGRWMAIGRDLGSYLSGPFPGVDIHRPAVWIYNQDLSNLVDIPNDTLDAVVSISALEHNTPEGLETVVNELMRVLKPGAPLLATLTAGRDQDWWHEASQGWCYGEASLRQRFRLSPNASSNYAQYDELFTRLKESDELRQNLARFYRQDDKKGMPGGVWNPEYQPVGVLKIKPI